MLRTSWRSGPQVLPEILIETEADGRTVKVNLESMANRS